MTVLQSSFLTTPDCAPILSALHEQTFSPAWTTEEFTDLLKTPGALVQILSVGEEPAGFCFYRLMSDEAEILTLAVLPDHRRRSYGENILIEGCRQLKEHKIRSLFLEVSVSNEAARRLYEKSGFQEAGRRRNYYREGDLKVDALILKKAL